VRRGGKLNHPMRHLTLLLLTLLALTLAGPVSADQTKPVPGSTLTLRIVKRDTETFRVQITNPTDQDVEFNPVGLYFVPLKENEEEEPQRLGVVSPGQLAIGRDQWMDVGEVINIAPHRSAEVKLTSYCLDAKRNSPTATTSYYLAGRRLPPALLTALAKAASSPQTAQDAIWKLRAAMPTSLVGD
jgi:hypothetical protein